MNQLTLFDFKNNTIRVVTDDNGDPWFVAKDVCEALDYTWNGSAAISHVPHEWRGVRSVLTPSSNQEMSVVSEHGLYFFLGRSDKPKALQMQKWVYGDVLPSIRKTGSYSIKPMTQLELARAQVALLERLEEIEKQRDIAIATKAEIGCRREATAMNTASQAVKKANKLEIELDISKDYCTVKRMQMIHHGQKFNWRLLKSTCIDMELPPIDVFDQNYGTVKAYHIDVWREAYAIDSSTI
jgi:prophage antirepressor-like protein